MDFDCTFYINGTGSGGGGYGQISDYPGNSSGSGGSGLVLIKQNAVAINVRTAPGVWNLNEVYDNVKNDTWTNGL